MPSAVVCTHASPTLRITELQEDFSCRSLVAHDPQHNKDRQKCKNVNDEHAAFECGKLAQEDRVEEDREDNGTNCEEHTMPSWYSVCWIVQRDHALNGEGCAICCTDESGLPAQDLEKSDVSSLQLGD